MKNLIARFVKDESGATAIEYGLIAAGIALAIIAVVNGLGKNLNTSSPRSTVQSAAPRSKRRWSQASKAPGYTGAFFSLSKRK